MDRRLSPEGEIVVSYYNPMHEAATCAQAWLNAVLRLEKEGPIYGLSLHIVEPTHHTETDHAIIAETDQFLRKHKAFPIVTVANTIFPEDLYVPGEPNILYQRYERLFPKIKRAAPDWGRYFHRMIHWPKARGGTENQLDTLVKNLSKFGPAQPSEMNRYNMYELSLFHPVRDANKFRGRQCLSFIEIKPELDGETARLHMTALYRSHFYVSKTLGNLIGLSRLLSFIARETGHQPGTLTVHSTYAELDPGDVNPKRGSKKWNKSGAIDLIRRCETIRSAQAKNHVPQPESAG